jgi:SAM-dependent methyltransferase
MTSGPRSSVPVCAEDYQERLARKSSSRSSPFAVDWLITRHLERSIRHAGATHARGRLLDVGCGGRPHESLFLPYVDRYVGVDTPASTFSRVDVAAVASHLPFPDETFDTVLCTEVLEHLSDPAVCLREMSRVLRPGGHLILTTPQMWHLHEEPYDFFRYTKYGLAHLCNGAGLKVVETRAHGGPWATIGIVSIIHLGSYAQVLWQRLASRRRGKPDRATSKSNDWQAWFWPFRLPICMFNLLFAVLDSIPHPGIYTMDHMVVARKTAHGSPLWREPLQDTAMRHLTGIRDAV